MNEVKTPKKPLISYYCIVILLLLLFNMLVMPMISQRQVKEVDYNTFMEMTYNDNIGKVELQDNQILFTDKDNTQLYKTGLMSDPELTQQMSPVLSFLLSWVLPIVIFVGLGQMLTKQMMKKMGGPNSMMFGAGKSNAKVYVKSSEGIKFTDVAGEDEAKENLSEIVDYLHNPNKYRDIGASMPKGVLLVGPPGTGKTLLAKAGAGGAAGPEAILRVHAKKIKVAGDVDFGKIARMASGASGAELANIINEAALRAVRAGRHSAIQADLEESIEVVIAGYQKKNAILTDEEKRIVAYHEIGHALVAALQSHSAPVQKITIVPRTSGALGYTMQVDEGNHYLMSKVEIENKIATLTGGRAAEEVAFGSVTTGASNDIEQATKLARAMITRYGMSEDFDMVALETVTNQYLGGDASLACSTETQTNIDRQVVALVKKQHEKAAQLLLQNRGKLDQLAQYLYEKETITGDEFMAMLNEPAAQLPQDVPGTQE